jgi:hypothetical protein
MQSIKNISCIQQEGSKQQISSKYQQQIAE